MSVYGIGGPRREDSASVAGISQAAADLRYLQLTGGALTGLLDLSAASAGQIKFPASPNLSANANTLDAYAEGTFTPVANSLGSIGVVTLSGRYRRVGGLVYVIIDIISTGSTTSTANTTTFTGLPFTCQQDTPICCVNLSTVGDLASGIISGTTAFPPSWTTLAHVGLAGCYAVA